MRSKIYLHTKEEIQYLFDTHDTKLSILNALGIIGGSSYATLNRFCDENDISFEKFNENVIERNRNNYNNPNKDRTISLEEILVEDSSYTNMTNLKSKLYSSGIKENVCEICGVSDWLGKPLTLQIHHINGKHNDHRIENVQILCPNCHAQTDNFAGANNRKSSSCLDHLRETEIQFIKDNYIYRDKEFGVMGIAKKLNIGRKTLGKIIVELGL